MPDILLVEDNKVQANAGVKSLESMGHEVTLAADGKSALKAAATGSFDLIILDLVLPDMHGNQICKWLKNNESTRLIPVIMLTSKSSINDRVTGLEAGADDYLQKPYNIHELEARIRACLRTKALQDELAEKNHELQSLLKEVERLALTDHLTGLLNRRQFSSTLQQEFNEFTRYKTPLACFLVDIDNFKSINDELGHHVGDTVLKEISTVMTKTLRNVDIVARWGGEEFVVLLPQTEPEAAKGAARRVLKEVSSHAYTGTGNRAITVSIGISHASHESVETAEDLVKTADEAMYQAKQNGKNRAETLQ